MHHALNQPRSACDQSQRYRTGRLHEIAVFTARSASGAAAMPVIGVVRSEMLMGPATDRAQRALLNRRFRRLSSNRGIRA